jgi:hypothetical protein
VSPPVESDLDRDHDVKSAAGLLDVLLESLADVLSTAASTTPSVARSKRAAWQFSSSKLVTVAHAPVLLVEDDPTEARRSEGSAEPAGRPMDR